MKQQALCLIAILSAASPLYAQEEKEWTLEDCINYALEKNIQLQQNKISLQESEIDVKSAKANYDYHHKYNLCHRKSRQS